MSFVVITVLAQTIGARDHASGLAEVFGLTFVAALLLSLLYGQGRGGKRASCRHMRPIGLMLGVFSRLGAVQFAPKRPRPGGDAYAPVGACPTFVDIPRKRESRHCVECFRCVNPQARGGLRLLFRRMRTEVAQTRRYNPKGAEIAFLFIATGLSIGGFLWLVLPPQYRWLRQSLGAWAIGHGWYWIGMPGPGSLVSVHPAAREVFTWLDFFMITGFMLGCAAALGAALAATTAAASWLAGRLGADLDGKRRFVELAYAYMPAATVSLVIGLGGKLFDGLAAVGVLPALVAGIKAGLFALSVGWSLVFGCGLLGEQGLRRARGLVASLPSAAGIALIALAWWPANFGT